MNYITKVLKKDKRTGCPKGLDAYIRSGHPIVIKVPLKDFKNKKPINSINMTLIKILKLKIIIIQFL